MLAIQAARKTAEDAGFVPSQVDGGIPPQRNVKTEEIVANFGIKDLKYTAKVHMGGCKSMVKLPEVHI